jgi:hypothetical protein
MIDPDPEFEPALGPEVPPSLAAPGPRVGPRFAEVSPRLIRGLKAEYGRGIVTDEGRRIGDLPEVGAWLDSLGRLARHAKAVGP